MKLLLPIAIFFGIAIAGALVAYALFLPQRYEYSGGVGGVNVRIDRLTSRIECLKLEEGDLIYGRPCPQGLFMLRLPEAQQGAGQQGETQQSGAQQGERRPAGSFAPRFAPPTPPPGQP